MCAWCHDFCRNLLQFSPQCGHPSHRTGVQRFARDDVAGYITFPFRLCRGSRADGPSFGIARTQEPVIPRLPYLAFILLQIPVALAQDAPSVLMLRFLGGVASAALPAIVGGYLADFLAPSDPGVAVAVFAAMTLIGPEIGAIKGAVLMQSRLGWRWTA